MIALRIKAQRPERTAKHMEKFYPEQGIGIKSFQCPVSYSRQATGTLTPVSTGTLMTAEMGSSNTEVSHFHTELFLQKAQLPPEFRKELLITEPSKVQLITDSTLAL